jgi:hypothetical protein
MATKTIADYTTVAAQSSDLLLLERSGAYFSVTPASIAVFYNAASQTSGINFAINLASQGTSGVNQLLAIATAGTTLQANGGTVSGSLNVNGTVTINGSLFVNGWGTMAGNLAVPNVQVGVGTVPTAASSFGTIYYDFTGPAYQQTTVDQPIFISGSNPYPGREIAIVLISTGGTQALSYSPLITWYGTTPPTQIGAKNVLIALTSLSQSMSGVIGATSSAQ